MRIAVPTTGKRKLSNKIADTFSRAPTFTIVTIEDDEVKSVEVVNNPGETLERGAGPLAARLLKENNVDVLLTSEVGPGASSILESFDIKIKHVNQGKSVKDLVSEYLASP